MRNSVFMKPQWETEKKKDENIPSEKRSVQPKNIAAAFATATRTEDSSPFGEPTATDVKFMEKPKREYSVQSFLWET